MSHETKSIVSPAWISTLLEASFGGPPPEEVANVVDAELCAQGFGGSKLGIVFKVGGGEDRPAIRVRSEGEAERLYEVVAQRFPAAGALVDAIGHEDVVYETDGERWRVFAMGIDGQRTAGRVVDHRAELVIEPCTGFPAGQLPDAITAQAGGFAAKVSRGMWFLLQAGDRVVSVVYVSENAYTAELEGHVRALGTTPGLEAALNVYAEAGLHVQPWALEFDGEVIKVCLWGALLGQRAADLPEIFGAGAPSASEFAAELVQALPERDQAEGRRFVEEQVYPTLMALSEGAEPGEHAGAVWRFLLEVLAFEAPFDRLEALRRVHAANRLALIQQEAFRLAIARYVSSHDVDAPAELPSELAGLDAGTIKAQAQALRAEVDALQPIVDADDEPENHRLPGLAFERSTAVDLLERAIGGDFAAAEGPLHDYLVNLGPTGYDDDPSLIGLDDIDLEADERDAVIEEALAADDDDLG